MAPWGPRGCGALVSLLLLLLLLLPQATLDPTCPTPMSVAHADIQVKNYHLHARERYTCKSGFKRKAGTSSLTQCVLNQTTNMAHWTPPNLQCIKPASTSKTGNTAATRPTPPAGTEGWYIHGSSPSLSQTTAKASEHSPSNPTGTASYSTTSRNVTGRDPQFAALRWKARRLCPWRVTAAGRGRQANQKTSQEPQGQWRRWKACRSWSSLQGAPQDGRPGDRPATSLRCKPSPTCTKTSPQAAAFRQGSGEMVLVAWDNQLLGSICRLPLAGWQPTEQGKKCEDFSFRVRRGGLTLCVGTGTEVSVPLAATCYLQFVFRNGTLYKPNKVSIFHSKREEHWMRTVPQRETAKHGVPCGGEGERPRVPAHALPCTELCSFLAVYDTIYLFI
ncbi:interleukin-15 receptor subunit alpha isoform X2 [Erinaceus europaeus]|uniref:Interleukin-15 receptor subunit alpha isoform X2 n=1 Tax=Erinaceus europaeus TaxID=9365 RepID=A0ABM3XHV2_ERIEU|nr:interleukin-15 receptor subunit alpha isoform X2 [Erinaceus europaeus]